MRGLNRRRFLGGVALGGAAAAVGGCAPEGGPGAVAAPPTPRFLPFEGEHQAGIAAPAASSGLMAAFTCLARDRAELAETFRALTVEARALMAGTPPEVRGSAYPPLDSGVLGPEPPPSDLSVVASAGASLFDGRYGLADRKPRELVEMPFLANDRLDPAQTHGDLLLTIAAERPDAVQHALRQLMRATRGTLVLHWMLDGFNRRDPQAGAGQADVRNLMGFKDGTSNLDGMDRAATDRHVWVGADDGEPDWAVGGSYHAVRLIRMFVEFWDRTPLVEQEELIGRVKATGAPLGGTAETETPRFDDDPDGDRTPLTAHIRLANPRTAETADSLLLRRGFSYTRGFDDAGRLDQGLAFVSYQRSLEHGFLAVQERLAGEPLEEYTLPFGGGFFYALPGVPATDRYLGDALLA